MMLMTLDTTFWFERYMWYPNTCSFLKRLERKFFKFCNTINILFTILSVNIMLQMKRKNNKISKNLIRKETREKRIQQKVDSPFNAFSSLTCVHKTIIHIFALTRSADFRMSYNIASVPILFTLSSKLSDLCTNTRINSGIIKTWLRVP